jgi:hypothetical protein
MKRQTKLTSQEQSPLEQETVQSQAQQQTVREFASVDGLLRHDALRTPVPPAIAHRLQSSISQLPPRRRSLWRRMFGG